MRPGGILIALSVSALALLLPMGGAEAWKDATFGIPDGVVTINAGDALGFAPACPREVDGSPQRPLANAFSTDGGHVTFEFNDAAARDVTGITRGSGNNAYTFGSDTAVIFSVRGLELNNNDTRVVDFEMDLGFEDGPDADTDADDLATARLGHAAWNSIPFLDNGGTRGDDGTYTFGTNEGLGFRFLHLTSDTWVYGNGTGGGLYSPSPTGSPLYYYDGDEQRYYNTHADRINFAAAAAAEAAAAAIAAYTVGNATAAAGAAGTAAVGDASISASSDTDVMAADADVDSAVTAANTAAASAKTAANDARRAANAAATAVEAYVDAVGAVDLGGSPGTIDVSAYSVTDAAAAIDAEAATTAAATTAKTAVTTAATAATNAATAAATAATAAATAAASAATAANTVDTEVADLVSAAAAAGIRTTAVTSAANAAADAATAADFAASASADSAASATADSASAANDDQYYDLHMRLRMPDAAAGTTFGSIDVGTAPNIDTVYVPHTSLEPGTTSNSTRVVQGTGGERPINLSADVWCQFATARTTNLGTLTPLEPQGAYSDNIRSGAEIKYPVHTEDAFLVTPADPPYVQMATDQNPESAASWTASYQISTLPDPFPVAPAIADQVFSPNHMEVIWQYEFTDADAAAGSPHVTGPGSAQVTSMGSLNIPGAFFPDTITTSDTLRAEVTVIHPNSTFAAKTQNFEITFREAGETCLAATSDSIEFDDVRVGAMTAAEEFTIENAGSRDVTRFDLIAGDWNTVANNIKVVGVNATEFDLVTADTFAALDYYQSPTFLLAPSAELDVQFRVNLSGLDNSDLGASGDSLQRLAYDYGC